MQITLIIIGKLHSPNGFLLLECTNEDTMKRLQQAEPEATSFGNRLKFTFVHTHLNRTVSLMKRT